MLTAEMEKQTTGELIREFRKKAELDQAEAAEKAGLTQGFWSQLEAGKRTPSIKTLKIIAKVLGVDYKDLLP